MGKSSSEIPHFQEKVWKVIFAWYNNGQLVSKIKNYYYSKFSDNNSRFWIKTYSSFK